MKLVRCIPLLLLAFSCARDASEYLQVVSSLPEGVVPRDAAIGLEFSRGIVPADSLNQWSGTPYIEFSPAIPGKFVWQDTARLVFSPDGSLPGDMKFSATLNTALLVQRSGAKAFKGADRFEFSTEQFTLRTAEFFYDRLGEKRQVGVKANLEFSYLVMPEEVQRMVRVTVDKDLLQGVRAISTEKTRIVALDLGITTQLDRQREIAIEFASDLASPETGTRIRMEKPFVFTLPPLGNLQIHGHEFGTDGVTGWIRVRTSQEVDPAEVTKQVRLEPAREFTVETARDGFTLRGKFEPGQAFRLLIKKGMTSVLGGETQSEYEATVLIGNIAPSFRFASESGVYMLQGGEKKLEIKTINMPKLALRVSQVFQNNLVFFLEGGRYYDYDWEGDVDEEGRREYRRKYRYTLGNYGRQLDYDTLTIGGAANQEVTTLLSLEPYLNSGYRGFYLIEIANPEESWRRTSKLVSVSDLGMIVKRSADEVLVFVTNLSRCVPVAGAAVGLVSANNQVIASVKTDGDGVARVSQYRALAKEWELKLITAELESDFNFINLEDYRVENSRFDVGGKLTAQGIYDAMLYGDRNIYRPGERIQYSGIVRNIGSAVPAGMPVRLTIFNPRGTAVSENQFTLNEQGSFASSYQTQPGALSGVYRLELATGTGTYLASSSVSVEDFVPDRLRLNLTPSTESARPGETITYDLQAFNFFGPPAAGRKWEFEGSFTAIPYRSKNFPDFRFADDAAKLGERNPVVSAGTTDENGKARFTFDVPEDVASSGLLRARAKVAVFDESGRPVYQMALTTVHPKEYIIGLRNLGAYYVSPNTPQKLKIVAVDAADRAIRGFPARVELIRQEWHSVLRQHQGTGTLRYVSEKRDISVKTDKVVLGDGPTEYVYSVQRSGDYIIRVSREGESGYNQVSFYAYSWGTTDITSFEVDPEARVDMVFDKAVYAPGEKARILFQAPFDGKMLVTVERNEVFSYRYLDVVNSAASLELPVEEKYLPNVYVTAVLFRNVKEMNIPLLAGHGFMPLAVERPSNRLRVAVEAPEKIRPRTKQPVRVVVGGESNAFVTLAAVDEGICQVKNYKTPDPYAYFYAKKGLETETFDFFRHLLPEPSAGRSRAGGSDADLVKRTNPLTVTRFKPLALWSGIVKTNGGGAVTVELDIPEFNGEVRLMALAYKGDRFGAAEKPMKVADPVVLTPALPRFLGPNDSLTMPIAAFNTTEKPTSLRFSVSTTGPIEAPVRDAVLEVGANQEKYSLIGLRTGSQIGAGSVTVRTSAFGEKLESTTELAVRPGSPFLVESSGGFVDGNTTVSHDVPDVYLASGRKAYVTLSPFPVANFAKQLKKLIGYPHGCLEQTVSKAFPQIYLRDVAGLLAPSATPGGSPTYFVNEAIAKIASMQTSDGTFLYWPGGGEVNPWTSVYATHFLLEAKKAGYAVPEGVLKAALSGIGSTARSRKTEDYYYYGPNRVLVKRIADKGALYALYVLAAAGQPDRALMDFYRNESSLLTTDTRYLLAGAYALSGDRRSYSDLLPPQFVTEEAKRTSGWNFDSPIRSNALILNVLLESDLNNPNIPRYMEYLSKVYRANEWYSTQDDAFTLLAFGKAARLASAANVEGTVTVGKDVYQYAGGSKRFDVDPFGKKVTIAVKGTGRVYYAVITEGIRTDGGVRQEDRNLQIRRVLLDRNGAFVDPSAIRQNDLIVVRLTLLSSVDQLENVAITDLLPAGFEIENPRITDATVYAFTKNAASPEYLDVRDDRVNIYTSFRRAREKTFYYAVRAVTAGVFQYPPVVAEAMYDGSYYSASGGGRVRIAR